MSLIRKNTIHESKDNKKYDSLYILSSDEKKRLFKKAVFITFFAIMCGVCFFLIFNYSQALWYAQKCVMSDDAVTTDVQPQVHVSQKVDNQAKKNRFHAHSNDVIDDVTDIKSGKNNSDSLSVAIQGIVTSPEWNNFIHMVQEKYVEDDNEENIFEKVFTETLSSEQMWTIFTLYSYIREVNPRIEAHVALVEASSLFFYTRHYGVPLSLAVGVAQTESNFRPDAVSSANARGVMQVMWKYHWAVLQKHGVQSEGMLHDPEYGILSGALVLSRYLDAEQSIPGALARYYGTLSRQYVGTTLANKHVYEIYTSGISKNWKASLDKERHYWIRMTTANVPQKRVATSPQPQKRNTKEKQVSTGTSLLVHGKEQNPKKTGGNFITIIYNNGKTKTWND